MLDGCALFGLSSLVAIVTFPQPVFRVSENSGAVQVILVLSNALPTDMIVEVMNINGTALGECYS